MTAAPDAAASPRAWDAEAPFTGRFGILTARSPGAIAIIQLFGDSLHALSDLTDVSDWPLGRLRLVTFRARAGEPIDEGLAARITSTIAQLMPHGGPRVIQRLAARLDELGWRTINHHAIDPLDLYPEAGDRFEALALHAISRAASPLAIDLLLDQPSRWRELNRLRASLTHDDVARSARLNRLIEPPRVVLAGPPNVGKSTLSNALLGRAMSITLDQPGTTRDYTAAPIDLAGLVAHWHDTPGLRETADPIEQRAAHLARRLMESADLLVAMTEPGADWPALPREPDLRVVNKCDLDSLAAAPASDGAALRISARTGNGLAALVAAIRDRLVPPADMAHPGPWRFDPRLVCG